MIVKGTSTQTIVNHMESEEERSIVNSDKRDSIHSDWSDLIPVNEEAEYGKVNKNRKGTNVVGVVATLAASTAEATMMPSVPLAKRTVKNIVLVLYTPRPNDWGSWQIRVPHATSTVASPHAIHKQASQEEKEEGELVYEPHSPSYSPVHLPKFYEDEYTFTSYKNNDYIYIYIYKICAYKFICGNIKRLLM